jgi:abhydrolase domain-containing protein 12
VINFHGNAGHLLQNQRPYIYRSFSTLSEHTHVLAFDYRGYGRSTGRPTERGLITDGVTVVNFALNEMGVPAQRMALLGQSLGTAVLSGTVEHFGLLEETATDFATVLLVCGFRDLASLLLRYRIGGYVPVLSPLARVPFLQKALVGTLAESWESNRRLRDVVLRAVADGQAGQTQRKVKVQLMHAVDDRDIPFENSVEMFGDLADAVRAQLGREEVGEDVGTIEDGYVKRVASWPGVELSLRLVRKGGHDAISTDTPVAVALMHALRIQPASSAV